MARDIYSFVKIEKRRTRRGIYATAMGAGALIWLLILIVASFVRGGKLPAVVANLGYLSCLVALAGLWISVRLRKDSEAYGKMVQGAFYVNLAAVIMHGLIMMIGILFVIM